MQPRLACADAQQTDDCDDYLWSVRFFSTATGRHVERALCDPCGRASWDPSGRRLVLATREAREGLTVYADGSVARVPGSDVQDADWDPSGQALVVLRRDGALERIGLDGRVLGALGRDPRAAAFDLSADGSLALQRDAMLVNRSTIWTRPAGQAGASRLTIGPRPRWSPDGRTIAFNRLGRDAPGLWTVPAAGGRPRRLVRRSEFAMAWSPDGRRLAYTLCRGRACEIRTVRADGTHDRLLARGASQGMGLDWRPRP